MTLFQTLIYELNKLRRYFYAYTVDGIKRLRIQMSRDAPSDKSVAWIETDVAATLDPDCNLTLASGQVLPLIDSGCRITVDGKVFELASGEEMGLNDVTICGGSGNPLDINNPVFDDSVQADTLPADTLSNDDTVPTDCSCNCNCTTSNIKSRIDDFISKLEGGA